MNPYDVQEGLRLNQQWIGATAKAFWSHPVFALNSSPLPRLFAAWGEVTERSFEKITHKPDWGIESVVTADGDMRVWYDRVVELPFCDLLHFSVKDKSRSRQKVLLIAPLSGHHATLVRKTVASLLPTCDVWVTEWRNARDIPVSEGSFDVEDYTDYLVKFFRFLGEDVNVMAVCQSAPLALVATALLSKEKGAPVPRTLILIGGPVDPEANPSEVTDFGNLVSMQHLEHIVIQTVGYAFAGAGRKVYAGAMQLAAFMAMNSQSHARAFLRQIGAIASGEASEHDRHNTFYDEYLAVMDMPAEFYLSTVKRVFKNREIARNRFTFRNEAVDITKIDRTAVMIIEGGRDDISAPGQCAAALKLLPNLPDEKKSSYVEPKAGHYGIFSGSAWRHNIRPRVLAFFEEHRAKPEATEEKRTRASKTKA